MTRKVVAIPARVGPRSAFKLAQNPTSSPTQRLALGLTQGLAKSLASRQGSTLVWVLSVILVILIVFGAALLVASSRFNVSVAEHQEQQAYYTALSSLDTVSDWIAGAYENGAAPSYRSEVDALLASAEVSGGVSYPLGGLASELGSCSIRLVYTDPPTNSELKLVATATFADSTETIARTLRRGGGSTASGQVPTAPPTLSLSPFAARAAQLNAVGRDPNPVLIGMFYNGANITDDSLDLAAVAAISSSDANREVLVEEYYRTAPTGKDIFPPPDTVGNLNIAASNNIQLNPTKPLPAGYEKAKESARTSPVGANGRMTINPLRTNYSDYQKYGKTELNNTRVTTIAISGTAGKNVLLRLGGNSRTSPNYNAILGLDFVDQRTGIANMLANPFVDYYPNNLNAPLTMSSDSEGRYSKATPSYTVDARGRLTNSQLQHAWYPQLWNSCTIFTQDTQGASDKETTERGIRARLVLMPYHSFYQDSYSERRVTNHFDYWGWGSYVANPNYGQKPGDAYRAFPVIQGGSSTGSSAARNKRGMLSVPLYYGNDFELYLLDNIGTNATEKADPAYRGNLAWIQQGVNVLGTDAKHSTIYSTRGMDIGGMHNRTKAWYTYEGINVDSSLDAFVENTEPDMWSSAYFDQLLWGTVIYNTDIILTTPGGTSTPRNSTFKRALNFRDVIHRASTSDSANYLFWRQFWSSYHPQTKIIGGHVYVGAGQSLYIEGGTQNYFSPSGKYVAAGANGSTLVAGNYTGTTDLTKINPGVHHSSDIATGLYNMECAPEDITVVTGGKLTLQASENFNVTTTIYLDGGTLEIQPGAKVVGDIYVYNGGKLLFPAKSSVSIPDAVVLGNIYAYNGGTVDIRGNVTLQSPHDDNNSNVMSLDEARDGIHIYGDQVVGSVLGVTSAGRLMLPTVGPGLMAISGSANRVHLLGEMNALVVNQSGSPITGASDIAAIRQKLLCNDFDAGTGACKHLGHLGGGWIAGEYSRE